MMLIQKHKIKVGGTLHDKRIKLLPGQRIELCEFKNTHSLNETARAYNVSKKLVLLYTNEESARKARETRKLYQLDGRLKKYYQGEQRAIQSARVADWRARCKDILSTNAYIEKYACEL